MTIEEAVETLNRVKWRERDDWHVPLRMTCVWSSGETKNISYDFVDAIAIASWLELREAVKPFREAAVRIIANKNLSDLPDTFPPCRDDITMGQWRRLTALVGGDMSDDKVKIKRLEAALLNFVTNGYDGKYQSSESAREQIQKLARLALKGTK